MRAATNRRAEQYIRQAKKRKMRNRIVAGLSVVVAIATTYALMLPGITMERDAQCGVEAHQHTEACYTANLICTQEEQEATAVEHISLNCTFQPHEHTSECYNDEHELGCGQSTEYFHRHDEMCVDAQGELICTLKEKIKRNHSASCYEEMSTQVCDAQETEGHQHTDECYTQVADETPSCGMEESNGHIHNEDCNTTVLTCTVEESAGHVHTEMCKETQRSLVCTEAEAEAHSHGEGCYENINELNCGKAEGEGAHSHGESCYINETTLTCSKAEGEGAHTHGDGCYSEESTLTCADETHEHDGNCYTTNKKLTCSTQESAGHAHGEACYAHTQKLNCNTAESAGHTHGESCYTSRSQLVCTKTETAGHAHGEACYTTSESIICGMEEGQGSHAHGEQCYTTSIACGVEEGAGAHQHNENCYGVTAVLSCGQEAGAGAHTHGEECYEVEKVRVCDHDELHEHDNSCFVTDKQNKRWAICGYAELMEHQHTEACVTVETLTTEGHAHIEDCYELVLHCVQVEHTHTDECYPNSTEEPTATVEATEEPTEVPSAEPTATVEVTEEPTEVPSTEPTATAEVTEEPTEAPTAEPTATVEVTEEPTEAPTAEPTATVEVTEKPTEVPTATPAPVMMQPAGTTSNTNQLATPSDLEENVSYCCGLEEHIHDETCLDENWNIVCGLEYHAHNDDCCHACGLAAHTHSTSSVQGDIMLLDEGSSGCYDAEGNLICGLEEHIHTEACSLASEDGDTQSETTETGTFTLSQVKADVTLNSSGDVLDLKFSAEYSISVAEAKNTSKEEPLVLKLDGINAEQLVAECEEKGGWLADSAGKGMNYRFVKYENGTYAMEIYYDAEKLANENETITGTIAFNATMDGTNKNTDGDYSISVGDETITIKPENIYGETPSETLNYDMTVTKQGNASLQDNKLTYTITVSTTKGFPEVNIEDVITVPDGLTVGTPTITSVVLNKQTDDWNTNTTTIDTTDFTVVDNKDYTLALPGITLADNEMNGSYTITVEYPIGDIGVNETINDVKNTVEATAKDNQQEFVTDSAEHTMTITSTAVSKSGRFDSSANKINWTIVVNAYNQDIAGAMVKDLGFLEALGLTEDVLAGMGDTTESDETVVVLDNTALQEYVKDTFDISPKTNVSLVKQGKEYFLRFDAGENNANTDKYTINYATTVEPDMMGSSVTNEYTYIHNEKEASGYQTVTIPAAGSVTKTNSVEDTTDLSAIVINWTSTIELPAGGIPVGGVIEDVLSNPTDWVDNQQATIRWFTWDQLNDLFAQMKVAWWWNEAYSFSVKTVADIYNETWMPFANATADQKYCAWQVSINNDDLLPTNENKIITLNYSSMLDAEVQNGSSASSYNQIKAGEKTAGSTYTWRENVVKKDGAGNSANTTDTTVTTENNKITWQVEVYVDDEYEEIVVTDMVPSVVVNGATIALELIEVSTGQNRGDATINYSNGTASNQTVNYNQVDIVANNVVNGEVSISLKQNMSSNWTWVDAGQTLRVYFTYKLPDELVNIEQTDEKQTFTIGTFTNTASVTVKKSGEESSDYGSDDQSQTITVEVPAKPQEDKAQFGKTGEYRDFVKADESNTGKTKEHVLEYTVDINKLAADLNDSGDTITVQDVLSHRTANYIQWQTENNHTHWAHLPVTANLDTGSVKLYRAQRNADGELVQNDGSLVKDIEVDKSLWSMSYEESLTNPSSPKDSTTNHKLTLTVPDGEAYVLEYTYEIDIDRENPVEGCGCNASIPTSIALNGGEAGFTNIVYYNNVNEGSHSTDSNDVWKASSSSVTMNVAMSIQKVDENNEASLLDGAKFTVYKWDSGQKDFVATEKVYTTVDGTFRIQQKEDGFEFAEDTAYYIVETEAPFGYVLPASPEKIYFYFASGTQDATLLGPDGFHNSYHELSKGGEKLTITNAKQSTTVNVTKTWDGNGTQPESVTVYLYRYALTEDQWKWLNEQETDSEPQVPTYSVEFTLTDYNSNGEAKLVSSGSILVNENDAVLIDFGTTYAAQGDPTAITSLTKNGVEIKEQVSGRILRIENVKENIVLVGATNWGADWWKNNCKISMTTESGSTGSITAPNVYTPTTLAALKDKQLDSSFSRVLTLKGDSWSGSVSDLDLLGKDANGKTVHYVYFIKEAPVPGWSSKVGGGGSDAGYNYTLTNTYDQSSQTKTSLAVTKVWKAADGSELPEDQWKEVQIQLYRKVKGSEDAPMLYVYDKYDTFSINALNGWTKNFVDLPYQVLNSSNEVVTEYEYFVQEITTGDFTTEITYGEKTATIINKVVEDPTEIHVQKAWQGEATSVKVYLRRYAVPEADVDDSLTLSDSCKDGTFNANNEQFITLDGTTTTGSFTNLEKSATVNGTKYCYFYYVEEDATDAANYTVTYANNEGVAGNTADAPITITNTRKEDTSLTVTKVWQDADGNVITENVPDSVSFTLWQVAGESKTKYGEESYTLNAANGWSKTFDALPQTGDNGETYTYEVQETAVDGYVTTYSDNGVAKGNVTIINKATRLTIGKTWLEADGQTTWTTHDSTVVYLQVSKDGTALGQTELHKYTTADVTNDGYLKITGANSVTLDKLPLGSYTVKEVGYQKAGEEFVNLTEANAPEWKISYSDAATLTETANTGSLTVTNTARTSLTVVKQWEGLGENENPPYTVYLRVKDGDTVVSPGQFGVPASATYTHDEETWLAYSGEGSITLSDLPPGSYTVEEVAYKANEDNTAIQLITEGEELPFGVTLPESVTLGTTGTLNVVNAVKAETGEITVKKAWSSGTTVPGSIDVQLVQIATPVEGASSTPGNVKVTFEVVTPNTDSDPIYDHVLDSHTVEFASGSQVVWKATYSQGGGWMPNNDGNCSAYILDGEGLTFEMVGDDPRTFVIAPVTVNGECTIRLKVDSWFWGNQDSNQLIKDMMWKHGYSVIEPGETVVQTYTLKADEDWQHTFGSLPLTSDDGQYAYTYRIEELGAGYIVEYTNNGGIAQGEITVKNTEYEKSLASITVEKKWFNTDGTVMQSPPANTTVKFQLWANENDREGETGAWRPSDTTYELTAANDWKVTIDGLVIGKDYYVKEVEVIDGDGTTSLLPYFTIAYSSDELERDGTITWQSTNTEARNNLDDYNETLYIGNTRKPTYTLPETGGGGTQWYTGGGAVLAGVALTLLYRGNKRKRRAEE